MVIAPVIALCTWQSGRANDHSQLRSGSPQCSGLLPVLRLTLAMRLKNDSAARKNK
jgi:hypothetical protein